MTTALKVSGGQRGSDAHDFESFDVSSVYAVGWNPSPLPPDPGLAVICLNHDDVLKTRVDGSGATDV